MDLFYYNKKQMVRPNLLQEMQAWVENPSNENVQQHLRLVDFLEKIPELDDANKIKIQEDDLQPLFQRILNRRYVTVEEVNKAIVQFFVDLNFISELQKEGVPRSFLELLVKDVRLRKFFREVQQDFSFRDYKFSSEEKFRLSMELLEQKDMIDFAIEKNETTYLIKYFSNWYFRLKISYQNSSSKFTVSFPLIRFEQYAKLGCGKIPSSDAEKLAVQIYTSAENNESYKINKWVRYESNDRTLRYKGKVYNISYLVSVLDSVLCSPLLQRLEEPIYVYRGVGRDTLSLQDIGYKSTTLDPSIAVGFCGPLQAPPICTLFQIELPKGFPVYRVCKENSEHDEMEIILSRGTWFLPLKGSFDIYAKDLRTWYEKSPTNIFKRKTEMFDRKIHVIRVRAMQHC